MAINFLPLFETLKRKSITWYQLEQMGIDNRTVHRIKHGENITTKTIDKLCGILECQPQDIIGYTASNKQN